MSRSSPRETIQLSLGPSANAITAHLLNLQGMAATSTPSEGDAAYCDALTTHYISPQTRTWVPRVLMIDEAAPTVSLDHQIPGSASLTDPSAVTSFLESTASTFVPWQGSMQVLGDTSTASSSNNNNNSGQFWKTASALAYSPYSRYHVNPSEANLASSMQQSQYRVNADNPRHVVWDDDDDEGEEAEEAFRRQQEAQDYARRRHAQEKDEWNTQTAVSLGHELETLVDERFYQNDAKQQKQQQQPLDEINSAPLRWIDFWMPPYAQDSKVVLPYSSQSQLVPHWDVAYSSSSLPFLEEWKEHVLFESLRKLLEPCDYGIQGAILTTEGCGMYASLAGALLEELQEECKSASRWINHVLSNSSDDAKTKDAKATEGDSESWQEFQVARVRQNISSGLSLYDFTEKAHAVLPLRLDFSNSDSAGPDNSLFRSSAQVAMALEACGLPFRLGERQSNDVARPYQMGLQNAPFLAQGGSDTLWGSTADRISMAEYLTMLQPSSQYSMLEMDVILQCMHGSSVDNQAFYDAIRQGTSVEQDQRMRQRGEEGLRGRPQDVMPGAWLQASHNNGRNGGLLSSLSYSTQEAKTVNLNRSVHHHFALSSAVRPKLMAPSRSDNGITMRDYLTCLVQGMGIRYRPERSMATVLDQTLGRLTFAKDGGGSNYGSGIYWKHLLPTVDTPVVAVLGNTTRAFGALNRIATDMKTTVRSSRFHGYVSRDVMNGVLPETDDCEEALEGCWDKRDLYHPPEGNGFEEDDDLDF